MIKIKNVMSDGCYELQPTVNRDGRGLFAKTFHETWFTDLGLRSDFVEQYYSFSGRRVIRGMHYQSPPMDHAKLIYCVQGRVLDVALDLRRKSTTYLQYFVNEMSADLANMVYLESGFAHGFYVLSDSAVLIYNVTSVFSPEHDQGIRWNSFGMRWPESDPILSVRDANLPLLADISPFK